jgi:hypothetical protein
LDEERASRRTVADAIELLRQGANLQTDDHAQIHVGLLALPSSQVVGLIDIQFEDFGGDLVHCVSLPTSGQFRAICQHSARIETYDILRLVCASVNGAGQVTLADGAVVHAVEVLPVYLHYEPSNLDWRIVHHVIAIAGAEDRCYRRWPDGLEFALSDKTFDRLHLDCSKLSELDLPSLKVLARAISKRDRGLKRLSRQKLADTLAMFGIRGIRKRPRPSGSPH